MEIVSRKISIDPKKVKALLNDEGLNKTEIKEKLYPTMTTSAWNDAWKQMGLTGKRPVSCPFEILPEEEVIDAVDALNDRKESINL